MAEPTICTIFTKNKLAHVRTLAQSFFVHCPDGHMVALLVDEIGGYFDPAAEPFEIVAVDTINIPGFDAMTMRYEQQALCAAVKPFFLAHLLQERGISRVCYFDPDVMLYAPLDNLFALLATKLLVLTPHLLDPIPDDRYQPDAQQIVQWGIFNLGFLGLANHSACDRFLRWWQQHMEKDCLLDPEQGLYLDQRWLDLAPTLFADVHIHRDPGCGVGYWNLGQRCIQESAAGYTVNGAPLTFFHYRDFLVNNTNGIAQGQNRHTLADCPQLYPLLDSYRKALLTNDYAVVSQWPYAYDCFDNGIPIPTALRQIWQTIPGFDTNWPKPRRTDQELCFLNWLNESEHEARWITFGDFTHMQKGSLPLPLLTNFAVALYQVHPEWQDSYPDPLEQDRRSFVRWFVDHSAAEMELNGYFVDPIRQSLQRANRHPIVSLLVHGWRWVETWFEAWTAKQYRQETRFYHLYMRLESILHWLKLNRYFENAVNQKLSQSIIPYERSLNNDTIMQQTVFDTPFGINVAGFLRSKSGTGCHMRDMVASLLQSEIPVARLPQPNEPGDEQIVPMIEMLAVGNPYAINLNYITVIAPAICQLLDAQYLHNRYNIGFVWWEFGEIPPAWISKLNIYHELWAGSRFLQDAFAAASTVPVVHMELPIPPIEASTLSRADLGLPDDKHIFLFVFDMNGESRKNPLAVIQAYREAFAPHFDDTLLILKTHNLERNPAQAQQLNCAMNEVSGLLMGEYLCREQMNGLFHACDAYVSLHRAEGLGVTMAEAMQIGKPVIATGYSGNMDFMTPENSYPVSYQMVTLKKNYQYFPKGLRWAEPNIEEAASFMRRVVNCPEEARRKGQLAQQTIQEQYGVETVTKKMVERLEAIHIHIRKEAD